MTEVLSELQDRTFEQATAATARTHPPERRLPAVAGSVRARNLKTPATA